MERRAAKLLALPSTDLLTLLEGFELTLEAEGKSPRTVRSYGDSVRFFAGWLKEQGLPTAVQSLGRREVERYLAHLLEVSKPSSAATRYRGLLRFFGWAVEEEELGLSPMVAMRPPHIPETPPPLLTEDELRRLLRACVGTAFEDRRDLAIVRSFIDTGARLSEISGLSVTDVDIPNRVLHLLGKGRRPRAAPFGVKTALALTRYLRVRASHRRASSPALWLGHAGPMTASGLGDVVERRGVAAGTEGLHPHQFRHSAAHRWQVEGGNESDLMTLLGWKPRSMLSRYAASAATERAQASHRRLALGDRL